MARSGLAAGLLLIVGAGHGRWRQGGDLRRWSGGHPRHPPVPSFVVCSDFFFFGTRGDPQCGTGLPPRRISDFFGAVVQRAQRAAALVGSGAPPALLHIGANRFRADALFYSELLAHWHRPCRMVLVEPTEELLPELRANAGQLRCEVQVLRAAVAEACPEDNVTFYKLGRKLAQDYPAVGDLYATAFGSNSLSKEAVLFGLEGHIRQHTAFDFGQIVDPHQYVEETRVPCLTPAKLLRRAAVLPSELAMLVVDAETQDEVIVAGLLDLRARPGLLSFEGSFETSQLIPRLLREGYTVGKHCERSCPPGGSKDVLAALTSSSSASVPYHRQ